MARKTRKKIGEILIEMGVVGTDQVLAAVEEAKSTGKRTGEVLVEQGACKDTDVAKALASQYGAEFLNFERPETLTKVNRGLLKEDMQKKYSVVPMRKEAGRLVICVHDPLEIESFDLIGMMVNARVESGGVAPRGRSWTSSRARRRARSSRSSCSPTRSTRPSTARPTAPPTARPTARSTATRCRRRARSSSSTA
ncbi:MAG: hypothetical protein ACO3QC_10610 [Phycisphaerales bacterium]